MTFTSGFVLVHAKRDGTASGFNRHFSDAILKSDFKKCREQI